MVALHMKGGGPLTKQALADISGQLGLSTEPLLRMQATVANAGQYYSPWSGIKKLQEGGWVSKIGQRQFQLTPAGKDEAARYAKYWEELKGDVVAGASDNQNVGLSGSSSSQANRRPELPTTRAFTSLCATASTRTLDLDSDESVSMDSVSVDESEEDHVTGDSQAEDYIARPTANALPECMSQHARPGFAVLVDTNEKPVVRNELKNLIPASAEARIFGVDYAFGRRIDEDWSLGRVLIERKTVFDYLGTLSDERGHLQRRVQESLRSVGFRVAVLLEGTNDLKQHPQQMEIMAACYSSDVDVLTTSSIHETADILSTLAGEARDHDGWLLSSLPAFLRPIYELDDVCTCEVALRSIGVAQPIAGKLSRCFGSLHEVLAQLPSGHEFDVEVLVAKFAASAEITLYQAGKALRILGVQDAPLPRQLGPRSLRSSDNLHSGRPRWRRGVLKPDEPYVEIGPGLPKTFQAALRASLRVETAPGLDTCAVKVCKGSFVKVFEIGDGTALTPGRHWLIVLDKVDRREVARRRARAYAREGIVSSFCASYDQAARHIAASMQSLGVFSGQKSSTRVMHWSGKFLGLAGVLRLARTAGGNLPEVVARNLANVLSLAGCSTLDLLVRQLRRGGPDHLLSLGVKDVGPERAAAICTLFLGK